MPPLAAAFARVGWAVATSAVASPAARRGRMERADLLLMVALERLLLLGVALLELLLLHHTGTCVVFLLSDALLLEVLHFRVVPLMHRSDLLSVLLFGVDLLLMVLRVRTFERINSSLCRFCIAWSCSVCWRASSCCCSRRCRSSA